MSAPANMRVTGRESAATLVRRAAPWVGVCTLASLMLLALDFAYGPAALRALWSGSVGSWYALTSGTLVRAVPLILTGLGVAIAFRAGVFNIGAEGQLLAGAAVATVVGLHGPASGGTWTLVAALVAGSLAGAGWAAIAAVLRAQFGILEVISTLMLNFIAADLVAFLVRGPLQEPLHIYPQSASLPVGVRLPHLGPATRLHWGFVLAVLLIPLTSWILSRTVAGFELRVTGANPRAAFTTGRIRVSRVSAVAFLVSGALAGLAGAIEVTAVTYALYENLSPGYGFTAIAVAILAGLNPYGVLASGVVFAALETGATAMQRDAGVPAAWASVVEACLILLIVGTVAVRARARSNAGGS
jgi:simple sugar transport system permease protein